MTPRVGGPTPSLGWAAGARRLAFRFSNDVVRALVPPGLPGTYTLMVDPNTYPAYVGRSDTCLRTRLCTHDLRGRATHFTFEATGGARQAWLLECDWYHRLTEPRTPQTLNQIHPPPPRGQSGRCPFCPDLGEAMTFAMTAHRSTTPSAHHPWEYA